MAAGIALRSDFDGVAFVLRQGKHYVSACLAGAVAALAALPADASWARGA
jgi:hypothetical protein